MNPRQNFHQLQPAKFHPVVEIKSVTWNKDNHGLFDYESQALEVKKFQIPDSSQIIKKFDNEIIVTKQPIFQSETILANIELKDQNSFLVPQPNKDLETYLIVRSLKNSDGQQKGYELKEGDILKLGRIEFKIIELNNQHAKQQFISPQYPIFEVQNQKREGVKTCRICLLEEDPSSDTIDQVFINPCNCKGTSEFVHLGCITPEKKNSSNLYLVHFLSEESIKLGRGHVCDIRISDISVSRTHAFLKFENGKFLVFDNNSKFGSLIKTDKPQPINQNKIAVQYGRTVLTFVMKYLPSTSQQNQIKFKQQKHVSANRIKEYAIANEHQLKQKFFKKLAHKNYQN